MRLLGPRLELRQSQSLVMTPQLQQAIKLLQLSNLEVAEFVEKELESNPLLEREEAGDEATPVEPPSPEAAAAVLPLDPVASEAPSPEAAEDWDRGGEPAFADWGSGGRGDFGDLDGQADLAARPVSLREHLEQQVQIDFTDQAERMIGRAVIGQIDECGYLQAGACAETAQRLGAPIEQVEAVLARVQQFDPPGIAARSLGECLALQLADKGELTPAFAALTQNLALLAKRDLAGLGRLCGVAPGEIMKLAQRLRSLDPKPGLAFDGALARTIVPDVLLRLLPDGQFLVELNPDTLPRVLVNRAYHARVAPALKDRAAREFVAERLQSANWLVKSLHQRAQTILKVASEIVRQQDGFFRHGVAHLKPLVLRDVANAIEMHESTVSRVTTNKFLAGAHGVTELKYFFNSSIASANGGTAHAAEAVRHRIRTLIDGEAARVLSDDRIVEMLRERGIDIARRTVAKYREALGIPSSVQRRRDKSLGL